MDIHVSKQGSDDADGSVRRPLATVNAAARRARPGDTVVVHAGVYREWVRPPHGGLGHNRRIVFTAAEGEHVVLAGSEEVTDWESVGDGVWRTAVDNAVFGDFNPYAETVWGDWLVRPGPDEPPVHLGEVYLNGQALSEVHSVAAVVEPGPQTELVDDWTGVPQPTPSGPRLVWHAEVAEDATVIHANFGDADPRGELVEINVRRSVFQPEANHVDHITLRGFEIRHGATPWAPPTADQPGMVGPNWATGWIIEDNLLHHSKCSAISLGKDARTGDNLASVRRDKPGYQYQLEAVFAAEDVGWGRERVGSHIVRRNTIRDCGQNGVVGHLGCVFSTIADNHIHHIGTRRQFYGHEIAGIKLHAPIDVRIEGNNVHDCTLAVWLDWQTQGTRVTRNVLHGNNRDLFVEVSHGPYVVDHNILASPVSLENFSQGGAYVNNLFLGSLRLEPVRDRATPYHLPHSTRIRGYGVIEGGDDRLIGNIFSGEGEPEPYLVALPDEALVGWGTDPYDGFPAGEQEYFRITESRPGDHRRFNGVRQGVTIQGNVYLGGAKAHAWEIGATRLPSGWIRVRATDDGTLVLEADLPAEFDLAGQPAVTGRQLGRARLVDADFEAHDGGELVLDTDLVGSLAGGRRAAGPLVGLAAGRTSTVVWRPPTRTPRRRTWGDRT